MGGTVIQGWRKKALNGRSRWWGVATETTPRDYCRASTESPHYSNAGCWEPTKVRWQASTCRTTWMNSRFGSIAGDPRAVASSSSGLCSKRSVRLPLPTKPWSNRQSQPSTYWGKLSQGDTHFLVFLEFQCLQLLLTCTLINFDFSISFFVSVTVNTPV